MPKDRTLAGHTGIAVVSLALATLAYCAPNLLDTGGAQALLDVSVNELVSVRFNQGTTTVALLCEHGHVKEVQVLDAPTDSGNTTTPAVPERYRPSAQANALIARLAQLQSLRALGAPDAAHLQSFGLNDPNAPRVVVTTGERTLKLTLGRGIYGTGDVYAATDTGQAYVFAPFILHDFDRAGAALWDAHIFGEAPETTQAFDSMVLHLQAQSQTYHRGQDSQRPAVWARESSTPAEQSTQHRAVEHLLQTLRSVVFLAAAPTQPVGPPTFSIALQTVAPKGMPIVLQMFDSPTDAAVLTATGLLTPVTLSRAAARALVEAVQDVIAAP